MKKNYVWMVEWKLKTKSDGWRPALECWQTKKSALMGKRYNEASPNYDFRVRKYEDAGK